MLGGVPFINEYEFDITLLEGDSFSICRFEEYNKEWASFIFKHRDDSIRPPYMHDYDIVYGPIADDRVGMQIRNFRLGYIDIDEFIRRLKYMKGITYQWAFCTDWAIKKLKKL